MKKLNGRNISNVFIILGIALIAIAVLLLLFRQYNISESAKTSKEYVKSIVSLIPEPENAVVEERRDNTMSTLTIDGRDFVGLIEMPRYSSTLAVCDDWGEVSKYPCRFSGSVYDGSMVIGASSQNGQYDFFREISVGDVLYYTDMEGNRYSYTVSDIRYASHADKQTLEKNDAMLTLFVKNVYAFEYMIIFCDTLK